MKGDKNGICNRFHCTKTPAVYFNISTSKYYCKDCAEEINYFSKNDHGIIICKENEVYKNLLTGESND